MTLFLNKNLFWNFSWVDWANLQVALQFKFAPKFSPLCEINFIQHSWDNCNWTINITVVIIILTLHMLWPLRSEQSNIWYLQKFKNAIFFLMRRCFLFPKITFIRIHLNYFYTYFLFWINSNIQFLSSFYRIINYCFTVIIFVSLLEIIYMYMNKCKTIIITINNQDHLSLFVCLSWSFCSVKTFEQFDQRHKEALG